MRPLQLKPERPGEALVERGDGVDRQEVVFAARLDALSADEIEHGLKLVENRPGLLASDNLIAQNLFVGSGQDEI